MRKITCVVGLLAGIVLGAAAQKPNILLIMADDMNFRDCSPYYGLPGGHPVGAMPGDLTPNMQRLADEGLRFDRCFNASPMCAPIRQQLFTGIYPIRSGAHPNHSRVNAGTKSMVHHLKALGYRVGLTGKMHYGPADSFPFEYLGGSNTEDPNVIATADAFVNRNPNQPYCLLVMSNNPHGPWNHGDYVTDKYTLPVPPDYMGTGRMLTGYNAYLKEINVFDGEVGHWMDVAENGPQGSNTLFICLTEQASGFPGGKFGCFELGMRTGCLIRWPGHVSAGTNAQAMVELVDILPTLIDAAGGTQPVGLERLDGSSFLPVLEGEKDFHKQYVYSSQTERGTASATPEGYGIRAIRDDRYTLIHNLQHTNVFKNVGDGATFNSYNSVANNIYAPAADRAYAQMLIDRLLIRPEYQLFDSQEDPFNLNDLGDDPAHAERIEDMKIKLAAWMTSTRDRGAITERSASTVTVEAADEVMPYEAWAGGYPFVWLADREPTADPDADGDDNLTEWIKNSDPLTATDQPGFVILESTMASDGTNRFSDLVFERRRLWQGAELEYRVEAASSLVSNEWIQVASSEQGYARFAEDPAMERATLRIPANTSNSFFRIAVDAPGSFHQPPSIFFTGTSSSDLGNTQTVLGETDFTITLATQLPVAPLASDQGAVLCSLGGAQGVSMVLLGDEIVLSGSASTNIANNMNVVATLQPSDFGKPILIRLSLDHRTYFTTFEMSYSVQEGSSPAIDPVLMADTGYIGTASSAVGLLAAELAGLTGTPFGPLAALPNGYADLSAWSQPIQFEIVSGILKPLSPAQTSPYTDD